MTRISPSGLVFDTSGLKHLFRKHEKILVVYVVILSKVMCVIFSIQLPIKATTTISAAHDSFNTPKAMLTKTLALTKVYSIQD